jgi:hypothetical protein
MDRGGSRGLSPSRDSGFVYGSNVLMFKCSMFAISHFTFSSCRQSSLAVAVLALWPPRYSHPGLWTLCMYFAPSFENSGPPKRKGPPIGGPFSLVEAPGVEPGSCDDTTRASTCLVSLQLLIVLRDMPGNGASHRTISSVFLSELRESDNSDQPDLYVLSSYQASEAKRHGLILCRECELCVCNYVFDR